MPKWIVRGRTAQELLGLGALTAAKAVGPTLGPIGRTVMLSRRAQGPSVVSDGFTIHHELELPDPFMDIAVRFLEDASERVRETCGDGTTTTVILAEAILRLAQPPIAMGADPMAIARGVRQAESMVLEELQKAARPLTEGGELAAVASLACRNKELGRIVAELVHQTGSDGAVLAMESNGRLVETELSEGFGFDRGVLSPHLLTDRETMQVVLERPYLMLTGQELVRVEDILPALERILPTARRLVIIAKDVKGEALAGLVMNNQRGNLELIVARAPEAGGRQTDRLDDLAAATGATVLPHEETGRSLSSITLEDLGRAERVVSDSFRTTIHGGHADHTRVERRIQEIRDQLVEAQTDQYKRYLIERIGSIQGQTGYLRVGGQTESEIKERVPRVRNAVAAAQEALRSGVVPGGGAAYVRAATCLDPATTADEDEALGISVLQNALAFPLRQLAYNAGEEDLIVLSRIAESPNDYAYDAAMNRIGPATELEVLDPLGTAEAVLRRACSVASTMLTVDVVIADPTVSGMGGERLDLGAKYE